ncbi:2-amino-4-hydroxy-6-hydroxymethyldihydropteridine diphosphokinase [Demequina zhanjiangensis]|uniref:Bifunctional folate synthesis protein n=1 Tax=Demequina zhanjiangensis TaxID=3051659 RepID=A0ABT8FYS3_9MICO|nr:2-amino-4-hydroxy-6-hydroxymethyldihydropteridine diphosphokinase [Demequina sp. SYSU T00b26]MDN4471992.1 2-amino-4-hydroxy-6-hydroxymethyldihydropteridine diphosphokinase [Demequina sp. SYSU T00b26]
MDATPYVKDGVELDQIAVHGIRVTGFHGVNANERTTGQLFYADVVAHVSTRAAAGSDDLTRTLNYSNVADVAAEILAGDPANLIETVAEHIALAVLDMEGVYCVDVVVHKPQAPLHVEFADVTVRIRRDLRTGGLWADKRIGSSAGMPDDPMSPGGARPTGDAFDAAPGRPVKAVLALGANLGDMAQNLSNAVGDLHRINGITVTAASPLVQSTPVGGPPQPDYLNAVITIETTLSPRLLLAACQGIEMVYGRERSVANGPRTLDIDIIDFDGLVAEAEDIQLPHPRAKERGFVLVPWAAFDADAVLPGEGGGRVGDLVTTVDTSGVQIVAQPQTGQAAAPQDVQPQEIEPQDVQPEAPESGAMQPEIPQSEAQEVDPALDPATTAFVPEDAEPSAPSAVTPAQSAPTPQFNDPTPYAEGGAPSSSTPWEGEAPRP